MKSSAAQIFAVALCLLVAVVFHPAAARPSSSDDMRLRERQAIAELASRIIAIAANPPAQVAPAYDTMPTSKRNAELINSLLGIPKAMSEAGKR